MKVSEDSGGRAFNPGSVDAISADQNTVEHNTGRLTAPWVTNLGDEAKLSSTERFEAFHEANPHVLDRLIQMCRQWRASTGGRKLGIRTMWEAMRWDVGLRTGSTDFKLNDHHTAFYVRLIALDHPDLGEMFETRRSPQADEWIYQRRNAT